jgi:hypothetical protein
MSMVLWVAAIWLVMMLVFMRAVHGSWRATYCKLLHSHCDWAWCYNDTRPVIGDSVFSVQWVGHYRCRRCGEHSVGCARWEQEKRILRGEPGDMAQLDDVQLDNVGSER